MRPAAFLLQFEQKTIGQISFLHHHLLKVIVTFILIIAIIIIIITRPWPAFGRRA